MATHDNNPYSAYDADDWNWEFLRRNCRYKKAYQAVERYRQRKHKSTCAFDSNKVIEEIGLLNLVKNRCAKDLNISNGLPCPDLPAHEQKEKPINKSDPVVELEMLDDGDGFIWKPELLKEYEVAVQIDTRCTVKQIVASLKELLKDRLAKQKLQMNIYRCFLAAWELRQQGKTYNAIAAELWPKDYAEQKPYPDKRRAVQKAQDHVKRAKELIRDSYRCKTRLPKKK